MRKLVCLLVLILSVGANYSRAADEGLDPRPITWWQSTWTPRPIQVSQSNAGSTSVTLTFRFRITQALPSTGLVEVYFPTGMTAPSGGGSNIEIKSLGPIEANTDTKIDITGVTIPSSVSAGWGPFGILTRAVSGGQILDINNSFATIYASEVLAAAGALTIIPKEDMQSAVTVNRPATLYFNFRLDVNLWEYDTIVITVPALWTPPVSLETCISIDVASQGNFLLSQQSTHQLQCTPTENSILVYGISNEVDISEDGGLDDYLDISLEIGGFTAPNADYAASLYAWTLSVERWGSGDVIRQFTGTGPQTQPGSILINYWRPHSSYPESEIIKDIVLYMDISFTITNAINQGGTIEISYKDTLIDTTLWKLDENAGDIGGLTGNQDTQFCYVEWQGVEITCATTTGKQTLTFANASVRAGTTFVVTALVQFSGNSPSVSVKSFWSNGGQVEVDRSMLQAVDIAEANLNKMNAYQLLFASTANVKYQNTGNNTSNYIVAFVDISASIISTGSGNITVNLPTNNEGLGDFSIFVSKSGSNPFRLRVWYQNDGVLDDVSNVANNEYAATSGQNKLIYSGLNFQNYRGATLGFFNNASGPSITYLPMVATNKATRYESWTTVDLNGERYVGTQILTFFESDLVSLAADRLCANLWRLQFQVPFTFTTLASSRTYYLEIEYGTGFNPNLGSGLSLGQSYPFHIKQNFNSGISVELQSRKILVSNQSKYVSGTKYDIIFAIEDPASGTETYQARLYFLRGSDTETKYILTQQATATTINDISGPSTITLNPAQTDKQVNSLLDQVTYSAAAGNAVAGNAVYNMQFPQGFTFDSGVELDVDDSTGIQTTYQLTSSNYLFNFPNILTDYNCGDTTCVMFATGVIASPFVQTGFTILGGASDDSAFATKAQLTFTAANITAGTIEVLSVEPDSQVVGRGPDSYHEDLSIIFTTSNAIEAGGKIIIVIHSGWEALNNTCTVTGLVDLDENTPVRCQELTSNTYTIDQFAKLEAVSTVKVEFTNVMPPANATTTNSNSNVFTSITTQHPVSSNNIDTVTSISNQVVVTPAHTPGKSHIQDIQAIPPNASLANVDLYIKFRLEHEIPIGGILQITAAEGNWSTFIDSAQNYVYFSKLYTAVANGGANLSLTLGEFVEQDTDLELYIERGISTPAATSTGAFLFKVTYQLTTLMEDVLASTKSDHKLTVQPALTDGIAIDTGITITNTTAGELSNYTFSFSSPVEFLQGHEIYIKFPREYSPIVESSYIRYQWGEPDTYYTECNYGDQDSVECVSDHYFVKVLNMGALSANSNIAITIFNVRNPEVTTATSTFEIYHMDGNTALAINRAVTGVGITVLPTNIIIKSSNISSHVQGSTADYTFELYLPIGNYEVTDNLLLVLPPEYDTNLQIGSGGSLECTLFYRDLANESTNLSEVEVTGISSCTVNDNIVTMVMPADIADISFTATHRFVYRLNGLSNPYWGMTRSQVTNFSEDFDANDDSVFTLYDFWTQQFQFFAFDTVAQASFGKSYLNVNHSYQGFDIKRRGFYVNDFNEMLWTNQIKVIPGTQTEDLQISTWGGSSEPFASDTVKFTPTINAFTSGGDGLTFTSSTDFTLTHYQPTLTFRVGASIGIQQGLYYVDWAVQETTIKGAPGALYDIPLKTLIEVYPESKVSFKVSDIPKIGKGKTSIPISIETPNSPHTDVTITISLLNTELTGITISPSELSFAPGRNERYFQISIDVNFSTLNNSDEQTLVFTLSGTDAGVFNAIPNKTFKINNYPKILAGKLIDFNSQDPTRTSGQLQAVSDSYGIYYWVAVPMGTDIDSSDTGIKLQVGDWFEITQDKTESTYTAPETKPSDSDNNDARLNGWVAFQRRLYKSHLASVKYIGAQVSRPGESVDLGEINDLFAETTYQAWCVVENETGILSNVLTTYFTTDSMPEAASFTMSIRGNVTLNMMDYLKTLTAYTLGVQPERLINGFRTFQGGQSSTAQLTTFTWDLPPYRHFEGPTPQEELTPTAQQETDLIDGIQDLGIQGQATFTTTVLKRSSFKEPDWVNGKQPKQSSKTQNSIIAEMSCNIEGEICGLCTEFNPDNQPTATQLLLGLNEDNKQSTSVCINAENTSNSYQIEITGLSPNTLYRCYYACYNDYPQWPSYNDINKNDSQVIAQTDIEPKEESFAGVLKVMSLLLLVFQFR